MFGTLYYRDLFKCMQFLLAHLPLQVHLDFQLVHLADSESHRIYCRRKTADWGWNTQDQCPVGATIVPVICASNTTHLTNFSGNQHTWSLYLTIGNFRTDIHCTRKNWPLILLGRIPYPPNGAKHTDKAWHSAVGIAVSPLWNLDITGPGLKWSCGDTFQRQF